MNLFGNNVGMNLRDRLAILAGNTLGFTSRILGRGAGAQISGRVMNTLDPQLLKTLAAPHDVILISGTNGKTTTTAMLTAALRTSDRPVISNITGANLASGIASALAKGTEPSWAVLEVDERVLARVSEQLNPKMLVLLNLSRDQLDRYGEVHSVARSWREVCKANPSLQVVANACDPNVVWAAEGANVSWVNAGVGWSQDASTCPACGALIEFTGRGFSCSACTRSSPATSVTLHDNTVSIGESKVELSLALPGNWNRVNATFVIAAANKLGIDPETAASSVNDLEAVAGRYLIRKLPDGRSVRLLLAKNPAGWHEILEWLDGRDAGVVIALNARIADGRDPSWLYDVAFERLKDVDVAVCGDRYLDIAVRLHLANIEPKIGADAWDAAGLVDGKEVFIVASYTQFHALQRTWQ